MTRLNLNAMVSIIRKQNLSYLSADTTVNTFSSDNVLDRVIPIQDIQPHNDISTRHHGTSNLPVIMVVSISNLVSVVLHGSL